VRWCDPDGRKHERFVPDAALHGDPASLCAGLAEGGLTIARIQQRQFAAYLAGANVRGRVTMVRRTGWHVIEGQAIFVLPGEAIGPKGAGAVVLDAAAHGPFEARGSLSDWQRGVGALASGHALAMLAISAAIAGPLLDLAGQEGGGLNFFGQSSRGKTTLLQLAASVWGRGSTPGYMRTWRATANGLEGAAASATDTALILDELGQVEARDAAQALYSLSNGSGKARAARDGALREPKSWRVLVVSSGELPTEGKLFEDRGRKARAGQLVRMLDVPADRGFGYGAFDNAGPDGDAGALAKSFKQAAIAAYGTAGREFVRRLIAEDVSGDVVRAMVADFTGSTVSAGADGQVVRAAQRFGLIAAAGELSILLGVTPWPEGAVREAAAWAFDRWIEGRGGTEPAEIRHAIEQVRLFIEQHGEARFEPLDGSETRPVANRAGWRKGSGADREWMIPPETWKREVCAGLDAKMVARILAERGMLARAADGNQQVRKIAGSSKRVFVVTSAIYDGGRE
jgi:putative DNA primase/helicase